MSFNAQVDDLSHTLDHIVGLPAQVESGLLGEVDGEVVGAILAEAGRFATDVIAPLNRTGDVEGTRRDGDDVLMPSGWKEAYRQWSQAGWAGLSCPTGFGGQDLPLQVGLAVQEMWNSASMAFGIGTVLTHGAVVAIDAHGTPQLQRTYLPKLVSGEWAGTMNLTESHAGSDLSTLRTRALPRGDGTYSIVGTKIFITYGEHDLTDNIVHLVLARLPDAPAGTRGISLFLVPKYLPGEDGAPGVRNDVRCAGVEHKLGIHASPTCVMAYGENGGAIGWLVGEENEGLACMFTMMNSARLHVGMQGVAIAERAWQQARTYAHERRQGRRPGSDGTVAIVEHPDVRRMLMTMKGLTGAARAICFATARALDLSHRAPDAAMRDASRARADLLTPVAKAFSTDIGVEVASLGLQIHGGMGFIEEAGAAQHYRDARIAPIYEGTNGIQAIDLVTRKLPMAGGEVVANFIAELRSDVADVMASNDPAFGRTGHRLLAAVDALEEATTWLLGETGNNQDRALAGASPYLRLFGLAAGGVAMARGALAASTAAMPLGSAAARINLARFFAENLATHAPALSATVTGGADALAGIPPEQMAP